MNKPFVRDNAIFIPAGSDTFILPEYRDSSIKVSGETLDTIWGFVYYGGNYRHRATDNPEADLAAVLAVYERNTAPKPRVPYVRGMNLYIPADKNGILPDYQDPSVKIVGMTLDPDWGYQSINRKFRCLYTHNHEAALAKVMEVYERNTNKDVVITITKLPPEPHPESGTEIPVPKCRVMLGIKIPDAASLCCSGLKDMEIFFRTVNPRYWDSDYVKEIKCGGDTMSAAVATAESYAADIRTAIRERKKEIAAYNEKRAAAIAAADEEYERRSKS